MRKLIETYFKDGCDIEHYIGNEEGHSFVFKQKELQQVLYVANDLVDCIIEWCTN